LLWLGYRWLRVYGLGEITYAGSGFYRVFLQSQIYVLVALLIIISLIVYKIINRQFKRTGCGYVVVAGLLSAAIVISFSRSFWVGLIGALLIWLILLIIKLKPPKLVIIKTLAVLALVGGLGIGFIYAAIYFPYPKSISKFSTDLIQERAEALAGEAGVVSRLNLLPRLGQAIAQHPIIGSGFGTTVTYQTEDPRILEIYPDGNYTTYAFEWGYLDIMVKMGLVGLLVYLGLIWQVSKRGLSKLTVLSTDTSVVSTDPTIISINQISAIDRYLIIGLLTGLVAILVTSIFSPYLNHPLGIGYILLLVAIF